MRILAALRARTMAGTASTPSVATPPGRRWGRGGGGVGGGGGGGGADEGRQGQHREGGDALAQQLAAAGGGCGRGVVEGHGFSCGGWRSLAVQAGLHAAR